MGENQISLFELANLRGDFAKFAIGDGEYFLVDREYGEHWVLGSWQQEIVPLLGTRSESSLNQEICIMLKALINEKNIDEHKKLNFLLYHLHVYYYLRQNGVFHQDALMECGADIVEFLRSSRNILAKSEIQAIELIQKRGGLLSLTEFRIPED